MNFRTLSLSCQGIKVFLSWVIVMGRQQGRVPSRGVSGLLRVLCEKSTLADCRGCGGEASLSFDVNNDLWPKGTYLQADLGCVQGKGEEVSKTGGRACSQELHSCCGRHL